MIDDLKPYPTMKDSGMPWLGEVPEHWQLRRMKTLLRERVEKGHPEEPLLAATQSKGVVRKDQYENRTVLALKDLHLLKLVRVGDFVISLRSFQGGIESAHEQGIISPAYTILHPVRPGMHGYLARLFKSAPFVENLSLFVTGIRQGQNIDYEKLGRAELPLPPLPEQAAIVRFLDHADRKIRRYIHAKQKLIKLLEEQKQAIIHLAVTRGLDSNVRLKPSGVEWLGDVPEHWHIERTKNLFRLRTQKSGRAHGLELLSIYTHIGVRPRKDLEEKGNKASSTDDYWIVRKGDLIVNKLLAWMGAVGVSEYEGVTSPAYDILMPIRSLCPAFYHHLFRTKLFLQQFKQRSRGIMDMRLRLYFDQLGQIPIVVPPVDEQSAIVAYYVAATSGLDQTIATARLETDLLREFRTRLIADVVTGKLDVRLVAAGLPEEAMDDDLIEDEELDDLDAGEEVLDSIDDVDER